MTDQEWLAGLKVGDEVAMDCAWSASTYRLERVTHATKTQVIVSAKRFNRTSGREIGGARWITDYIYKVTDEIRERVRRSEALSWLERMKWADLDTDILVQIIATVRQAQRPREGQ